VSSSSTDPAYWRKKAIDFHQRACGAPPGEAAILARRAAEFAAMARRMQAPDGELAAAPSRWPLRAAVLCLAGALAVAMLWLATARSQSEADPALAAPKAPPAATSSAALTAPAMPPLTEANLSIALAAPPSATPEPPAAAPAPSAPAPTAEDAAPPAETAVQAPPVITVAAHPAKWRASRSKPRLAQIQPFAHRWYPAVVPEFHDRR